MLHNAILPIQMLLVFSGGYFYPVCHDAQGRVQGQVQLRGEGVPIRKREYSGGWTLGIQIMESFELWISITPLFKVGCQGVVQVGVLTLGSPRLVLLRLRLFTSFTSTESSLLLKIKNTWLIFIITICLISLCFDVLCIRKVLQSVKNWFLGY